MALSDGLALAPQVRSEVARQLREARAAAPAGDARGKIELYETDPRKENAMPLSARCRW